MARVTVEDCVDKIPNRYELLLVASQRARDIGTGAPLTVERDGDKNSVVSLREIAEETISIGELQKSLVMNLQKYVEVEEPEEEELEILAAEKELADLDAQFASMLAQAASDNIEANELDEDTDEDEEILDVSVDSIDDIEEVSLDDLVDDEFEDEENDDLDDEE